MEEKNLENMTGKEKLSNFWYYHKWHTLVALFLIFTLLICSLQMCNKTSYDIHIMYAGPHEFKRTSQSGDVAPYVNALSSLKYFADDFNGDGNITVDFLDLYLLTSQEMQDAAKDPETELNYALLSNNKETFTNNLMYSDFYVCLLSSAIYEQYKLVSDVSVFTPLESYVSAGTPYLINGELKGTLNESLANGALNFYDEGAIYLSSTALYSMPEFSSLPNDTLLCLRIKSAIASHFGKEQTQTLYKNAENYIKSLINSK